VATAAASLGSDSKGLPLALSSLFATAGKDVKTFEAMIEQWYVDAMDRLSGYYKRWTKWMLLGLSVIVVVLFNVNTLLIAQRLYTNVTLRSAIVQEAGQTTANPATSSDDLGTSIAKVKTLPVGWNADNWNPDDLVYAIIGWLVSIGAVSLGAPFWFDLLNRFNSLRSTGPPPPKNT
jgi:hypothetical protein